MVKDANEIADMIQELIDVLKSSKPNDRSDIDRSWAICITDTEKLSAYFNWYIVLD